MIPSEDGNWSGGEAVGGPSRDSSPEGVECVLHYDERGE